jgi:hypothetical protein
MIVGNGICMSGENGWGFILQTGWLSEPLLVLDWKVPL